MRCSASTGWVALAGVLAGGALLASGFDPARLDWRPALAAEQPWRAWTAAWVHLGTLHLAANVAGAVLVGALGAVARLPWRSTFAWAAAWPLTQLGLQLRPDLYRYAGLSGVLHAGVACVGVYLVVRSRGGPRLIGAALLAGAVLKVLAEAPWGPALRHPAGWDIAVAPFAHASGLIAGLAAAAVAEVWHQPWHRPP